MLNLRRLTAFILFCLMPLASYQTLAQADDAQDTNIPSLPAQVEDEDVIVVDEEESDQGEILVREYEGYPINYGLFTDTSATRGLPRYFNALDLSGYMRFRMAYFRNAHLKTYIPEKNIGTSLFPPSLSFIGQDSSSNSLDDVNPDQNNFSSNMRLRLDPTINITQVMRVRTTVDVFDNMVFGSTSSYEAQGQPSPNVPVSMMSMSQSTPTMGVNSNQSAIRVKRAWGEASFPIGELRFGRMPFHWGLGILYNSGDDVNSDYGDQIDGLSFTTRILDHYFTPSYSIAYTGPIVRGGGQFPTAENFQSYYLSSEAGQRYPLEPSDLTHVLMLSFLKRDSDFIANKKRAEGRVSFNYGIFASYRKQMLDSQNYEPNGFTFNTLAKQVVKREGNVGLASLWSELSYKTFHLETEMAGIWGKYQIGEKPSDQLAKRSEGDPIEKRDVWLLQGGVALESRYGFLQDRLQVGIDSGWASSQAGPGFGIREGSKDTPKNGDPDGRKLPSKGKFKSNFKFNPAYTVDLLLYKEVLGTVASTVYIKPHLSYFFSQNFGLRTDVITSFAPHKSNTAGNSNWLGAEFDASAFLRTDSGFFFSLSYGLLVPLKGLNHQKSVVSPQDYENYGVARVAQTLQLFFGLLF